jgi:plasmid stabilization system protein ParE
VQVGFYPSDVASGEREVAAGSSSLLTPVMRHRVRQWRPKQRRQAEHIEESYEKKGVSKKTAAARAYATVNKQDGGGKKSGSGRKKSSAKRKTGAKKKSTPKT